MLSETWFDKRKNVIIFYSVEININKRDTIKRLTVIIDHLLLVCIWGKKKHFKSIFFKTRGHKNWRNTAGNGNTVQATGSDCQTHPDFLLRREYFESMSVSRQRCDSRVARAVRHTLLSVDEERVCFASDVFLQGQSTLLQVRQRLARFIELLLQGWYCTAELWCLI